MTHDTMLAFSFPAVCAKKITAAFDGGRISSDGGVMLLAQAEHRLGIAEKLAAVITDPRDPMRVVHSSRPVADARDGIWRRGSPLGNVRYGEGA
jgi:Transposase DDE domain group 1